MFVFFRFFRYKILISALFRMKKVPARNLGSSYTIINIHAHHPDHLPQNTESIFK